jgi:(2Fe-2S) ferredoxin
VYRTFLEELAKFAAGISCNLTSTGCLGPCALGAVVLVYPGGFLYGRVTPNDVHEIVSQHIVGGKPVTRLIMDDAAV